MVVIISERQKKDIIDSYQIWKARGSGQMLIGIIEALASIGLTAVLDEEQNLVGIEEEEDDRIL